VGDLVLGAEAHHLPVRKISPVVGDDGIGKSKATHVVTSERGTSSTHFVK